MDVADAPSALVAALAGALGLTEIPADDAGGWHISFGDDDAYLYCRDGAQMVIVVPVCPLPTDIGWVGANLLLRANLFDSPVAPFQLATDEDGQLVQWGLLPVAELEGASLALVLRNLLARAAQLRNALAPTVPV